MRFGHIGKTGITVSTRAACASVALPCVNADPDSAVIVVGINGSDASWRAFWWARGEARRSNRHLVAIYVNRPVDCNPGLVAGFDQGACIAIMDEACAEQAHELEEVVEREGAGVEARFVHVKGDVAGQMMRLALAIQADVIAVGRSTKRRQRVACSIGRRLTRFRNAPVVVIVP